MRKIFTYDKLAMIVFAFILVGLFFLPLAPLREQYKHNIVAAMEIEGFEMENDSSISMLDYASLSLYSLTKAAINSEYGLYISIELLFLGVVSVFVLIFSLLRLPFVVLVFDVLTIILYQEIINMINFRLLFRFTRNIGISYILYYPTIIAILSIAIEMICRNIYKKGLEENKGTV